MDEKDIRAAGLKLVSSLSREMMADLKHEGQKAEAEALLYIAGNTLIQALVDVHRIADALEQIALNTQPGRQP